MSNAYPAEYKSNRIGQGFQAITSSVLICLCTWFLFSRLHFSNIPESLVYSVVWSILILSLILLYFSVLRLINPLPELRYHDLGFDCKIGNYTLVHVKWEDVKDLAFINTDKEQILAIILDKPSVYIRPLGGWTSIKMKARLKNYGTPIILSSKKLHIPFEKLQLGFVHYWNQYKFKTKK